MFCTTLTLTKRANEVKKTRKIQLERIELSISIYSCKFDWRLYEDRDCWGFVFSTGCLVRRFLYVPRPSSFSKSPSARRLNGTPVDTLLLVRQFIRLFVLYEKIPKWLWGSLSRILLKFEIFFGIVLIIYYILILRVYFNFFLTCFLISLQSNRFKADWRSFLLPSSLLWDWFCSLISEK